MHDQTLTDAANALARAIGNRWAGWYQVSVDKSNIGTGSIRVDFDQTHRPVLTTHAEYNGYRVLLRPTSRPEVR